MKFFTFFTRTLSGRCRKLPCLLLSVCLAAGIATGCGGRSAASGTASSAASLPQAVSGEFQAPEFEAKDASVNGAGIWLPFDEVQALLGVPDSTEPHFPETREYRTDQRLDMVWNQMADNRVEVWLYTDRFRLDNGVRVGMTQKELCALFYDDGQAAPFVDSLGGQQIGMTLYGSDTYETICGLQAGEWNRFAYIDVTQHEEPVAYTAIVTYVAEQVDSHDGALVRGDVYEARFYLNQKAEVSAILLSLETDIGL